MGRNKLVYEGVVQKEMDEKGESSIWGIPVCRANFSTPVLDQAYYVGEIHYKIGERLCIENAD